MADLPSQQEIEMLKDYNKKSCVSIFLPLDSSDSSNGMSNPNRIKLKNTINRACEYLLAEGVNSSKVKKTKKNGLELLDSRHAFWPNQQGSIAIFLHEDMAKSYELPEEVEESMDIKKGFNTKPLEKFIKDNHNYFLLALSHNNIKLYEGDRYGLKELNLEDLPTNMEESLNLDEYPRITESHGRLSSRQAERTGAQAEGYHSHYNKADVDRNLLINFFRKIDRSIRGLLKQSKSPLLLAGVDYLIPLYKKVNTYDELHPKHLSGNFENSRPDILHKRAWATIAK